MKKPRKPYPETKTLIVRNVPGEVVEVFNRLVESHYLEQGHYVDSSSKTRTDVVCAFVLDTYRGKYGEKSLERTINRYLRVKKAVQEANNYYNANFVNENEPN